MSETVEPFSNGVEVGLRLPVILVALAGVVLALVLIRRLGALAGLLGAAGGLLIAADQVVNIAWVLHLTAMANGDDYDADTYVTAGNAYTIADVVLVTLGVALLIGAVVAAALRKPAATAHPQQSPFPQQAPFPHPQQAPYPQPQQPLQAPPFDAR
ncbi:hypothetical protein OHA72_55585 [Dactylosporangium sp. NBC_01737]|uniref:hypothetical protein n=1 Tax=Dactylosporangium sp. NBC_01737 TaxID=2975959 RepID=UPI002E0E649B|nr:hypothetical protein OHA72_55585 [Dactylosporangium sp. NBC_01737]